MICIDFANVCPVLRPQLAQGLLCLLRFASLPCSRRRGHQVHLDGPDVRGGELARGVLTLERSARTACTH